jgi:hypothetical protein
MKYLVFIYIFSLNLYANDCSDYINNHIFGGANTFFAVDDNLKPETVAPFVTKIEKKNKIVIKSKSPFSKVVLSYDKDTGKLNSVKQVGGFGFSKDGIGRETTVVSFNYNKKGDCIPSKRVNDGFNEIPEFDTKLCRDIVDLYKESPELKACADKAKFAKVSSLLKSYDQDRRCNYCGAGNWSNFFNLIKNDKDNPLFRSMSIYQNCVNQGLESFIENDDLWELETVTTQVKKAVQVKEK